MGADDNKVNAIFDELCQTAASEGEVSVGDITESLGHRGFGPLLAVPALIEISPIGGIPGVPTVLALIVGLFAVQIAFGRRHLWLPDFLKHRSVSGDKLRKAIDKMRPFANWLDKWFHERLPRLTEHGAWRVAAMVVIVMCLTVPPLELIPFASTAPMGVVVLMGVAMTVRDGALMLAAYGLAGIALVVVATTLIS